MAAPLWSVWRTPRSTIFAMRTGRDLSDREASYIAAQYLQERLEEEDDQHTLYDVPKAEVERLIQKRQIK